jgi:hypothetical protein
MLVSQQWPAAGTKHKKRNQENEELEDDEEEVVVDVGRRKRVLGGQRTWRPVVESLLARSRRHLQPPATSGTWELYIVLRNFHINF